MRDRLPKCVIVTVFFKKEGVPGAESAPEFHRNKEHPIKLKKELAIQKLKFAGYNLDIASKDRNSSTLVIKG